MSRYKPVGWRNESLRHSLAAKGLTGKVDLNKYQGKWRQVYVNPTPWFQKGCRDVTAEYKLNPDGTVKVVNSCDDKKMEAVARSVSKDNRKLIVDFGFPFPSGEYNIKKIDQDYRNATVEGGGYRWELRRSMAYKIDPEKYRRWRSLVNMSPSELRNFMNDYGDVAGLSRSQASAEGIRSGRDSARAIIRMKEKGKDKWTDNDVDWMNRQISFVSRMKGAKGPLYDEKGMPTRKMLALKVWGHDPNK